jgi:hypothetical protein
MTREQSECSALLKLGDDGVWFCPECGLRISLPAPRRGRRAKRPEVTGECCSRLSARARVEGLRGPQRALLQPDRLT